MSDDSASRQDLIYYDDQISMLERTAYRVYPIINDICNKLVASKVKPPAGKTKDECDSDDSLEYNHINMKCLLGYLNQSEWLHLLNIGNIM